MPKLTKQQEDAARWGAVETPRAIGDFFCPVRTTLNLLGGKWKLLILASLLDGARRYGELRRLMPEITEKMLIQELRELEADGLVARTVHQQVPPRVEYALVGPGEQARPVLQALVGWGQEYLGRTAALPVAEAVEAG
ncbi:helix-turn-helix domain-containing protein [Hymenobacter sp.]|uniref:winged helix-turn-helix transcriptional regulator n=1 Tax=Hymenobacter sp. TaxID=1898978 RepID=UPI00286BFD18|nr:helix-turn-helix domain-containing protein [Hymenobacter sp.]